MREKTILTCLFLLTVLITSSAQSFELANGDTINVRDANNQKQGWWKVSNKDGKYKGYQTGQLVEEGEYLNNKKRGVWTKFFANGNKKHELTFANNIANGYAKMYYRSGKLQEEGVWKMNRWSGQYKYYYENGNMKYDWSYNSSGKREGEQKYFHENGVLQYFGGWKQGQEAGELTEYYEDGSIKAQRFFDSGKIAPEKTRNLVRGKEYDENVKKYTGKPKSKLLGKGEIVNGFNKLMNRDGTVSKEGIFKDKKLVNGKVYVYENGRVIKTINFEDGKRIGEETVQ
ncbi:MAG: hypothetical protein JKX84_09530 [Flavobacteriales bacterium]|nr:hypothetical protein [Flavobacteriales bacterium]